MTNLTDREFQIRVVEFETNKKSIPLAFFLGLFGFGLWYTRGFLYWLVAIIPLLFIAIVPIVGYIAVVAIQTISANEVNKEALSKLVLDNP